jgi:hypothetical protein
MVGMFVRNISLRENLKLLNKDLKEAAAKEYSETRKAFMEKFVELLKERAEIRAKLSDKAEKEKKLMEICLQDTTEYEVETSNSPSSPTFPM